MIIGNDEKVNTTSIDVTKILPVSEAILEDLMYWIKRGTYGNVYDGKRWIRNTQEKLAEHLGYSRSHTKRGLKQCQDLELIEARCFSWNKRNREKSYTIVDMKKVEKIQQELKRLRRLGTIPQRAEKSKPYKTAQKVYSKEPKKSSIITANDTANELSNEPMYIYQKKIHKSYKSNKSGNSKKISAPKAQEKSLQEHNETLVKEVILEQAPKEKPHIVQDMIKSLTKIFPGLMKTFRLTKAIARNLVAAFKHKFHNSIETWERYLKLIKTSSYLNGDKFKLSIHWILKFLTIDRIQNGEFGVNPDNITLTDEEKQKMVEDKKQQIQQKIAEVNEPETCKQVRVKVLEILGNGDYQQYFENQNKCRFTERNSEIVIEILGSTPWNFFVIKERLEKIGIKVEWINNEIKVEQENGYTAYCMAKSFEELKTLSALYLQQKKRKVSQRDNIENNVSDTPFWKRAFKPKEQKTPSKPMTIEELQQLKAEFKKRFGTNVTGTGTPGTNYHMPDVSKTPSNAKAYNAEVFGMDKSGTFEYPVCNLAY